MPLRDDVASYVFEAQVPRAHHLAAEPVYGFTLLFFSISTNQEYYTFPVWPPLFILIAGVMAGY